MIATTNMHKSLRAFGACCVLLAFTVFASASWAQSRNSASGPSGTGSACAPAGYVHEVSGVATIQRASAKEVPAKVGDMFEADTVFRTGADGKEILKFADGQVVALGPDSVLRVGRYCYLANNLKQSTSSMELMKGEMRFVTGLIGAANPEGVHISAGDSTVSIQKSGGADFTVVVNPDPQEVGAAVVARGEISVDTPYGPIHEIAAGQYVPWQPGRTPPLPLPIAAAPAVIQAGVAALWAMVLPDSAPAVIASVARMAVAAAATGQARAAANADPRLAGYVDTVSSNVSIRTATGKSVNATIGTVFAAGATFNTGTDGRVVLKFADGQVVVLGPGSVLGVDQYQFDPRNLKASNSSLDLVNGEMRYVSGAIHAENHAGVSISAGASLVDILNTGAADFTVAVKNINNKEQEVGVAAVAAGEISVHTPYGPISKIESGQAAPWQPGQTTLPVVPLAAAPASIQAGVAELSALALPENTPVVVQSAALAAAAVAAANRAQAAANADPGNARLQVAAHAAADQANTATQAAAAATQAIMAAVFAGTLAALPATAAGPALAQVPATVAALPVAPIAPTVTPGAGGGCTGSKC